MADYEALARFIVGNVVEDRDAVSVAVEPGSRSTLVTLSVAPSDMGKVIGKGGRNIDAIRAVVRAAGLRDHQRVQVELEEGD